MVAAAELALKDAKATSTSIATHVEVARTMHEIQGTKRLLPHDGTAEERIALFAKAVDTRQNNSDGGALDPEAVISACARACGNKKELFGAARKRQRREDLK